ncbi:LOW QUALITY PROTEIN: ATP synthase-coupling factor 6, mitochondrial [Drosophila ficusphila]|uniref:LOW QUALITY PROTEIN: ATP synthase-coupling factor 6, mitochondrial n=1 Tax=Drosophila ficusphila TaxID=30025 RepID=UPI001C89D040|nr:LOW QUALITY PROTEIN: ATP synthase-coupling factor 6, mitochondrial [Drosophila ficusphila]
MFSRVLRPCLYLRRSIATSTGLRYKDPIYPIFLDKVREYKLKSPTGKPVDVGPEYEAELKETIDRLALKYGGGEGIDMLQFPKFVLPDIDIDPTSICELPEYKQMVEQKKASEAAKKMDPKSKGKDNDVKGKDEKKKGGDKEVKAGDDKKGKDVKKAEEAKGKDEKDKKK